MDPSRFLEVTLDGEPSLDSLTEDDIVLLDNDYDDLIELEEAKTPLKRRLQAPNKGTPPLKKSKKTPLPSLASKTVVSQKIVQGTKFRGVTISPKTTGIRPLAKQKQGTPKGNGSPSPSPLKQSITWNYRQLPENQYTADIRKSDLLKNYEPEKCSCKRFEPKEGETDTACGAVCINRSTYSECDPDVCVNGKTCTNMPIQKRQYAPGLERFMTAKKGWGVRARQSIAKGSFILEYTGEICTSKEFERRMLNRYKVDNHHYCLAMDNRTMIDAHRAGSECRFVNHSCEPNCEMEKWNVGGLSRMALFSLRDILPTEEICYDYNFSLFNTDQGQDCMCGAKTCRGVIGGKGKDYLITLDGEESTPAKGSPKVSKAPLPPDPNSRTGQDGKWFAANLSPKELKWVVSNAPVTGQLEAKTIKCSVCNDGLNFRDLGQCQRHPDLGVLICSKCRRNYGKGGWVKDPDGNDEFCRWCSEGGQIYLCDFCPHAFCNKCLRWNLGRKYLKKIDEEEKWKCVLCDPSFLREARALYWAIYKFHKDKPARGGKGGSSSTPANTPARGEGSVANGGKAKTPRKALINGRTPGGKKQSSTIEPSVDSTKTVNRKPQKNGAAAGGVTLKSRPKPHINGIKTKKPLPDLVEVLPTSVTTRHYVDQMIKDTDDCIAQFVSRLTQVKRKWRRSKKKDGDVTVYTKKLREILNMAKRNIVDVDKKVVNSYRTNLEDADVRDIDLEDVKDLKEIEREKEIFSKSKDIGDSSMETVESTPDLPFLDSDPSVVSDNDAAVMDANNESPIIVEVDISEDSEVASPYSIKEEMKFEVFSDVDKFTPTSDSIKDEVLEEMDKSFPAEAVAVINAKSISTVEKKPEVHDEHILDHHIKHQPGSGAHLVVLGTEVNELQQHREGNQLRAILPVEEDEADKSEVLTESRDVDPMENLPTGNVLEISSVVECSQETVSLYNAEIVKDSIKLTEDNVIKAVDSEVVPNIKETSEKAPSQDINDLESQTELEEAPSLINLDGKESQGPANMIECNQNIIKKSVAVIKAENVKESENEIEEDTEKTIDNIKVAPSIKEASTESTSQDLNYPEVENHVEVAHPLIELNNKQSEEREELRTVTAMVDSLCKDSEIEEAEKQNVMSEDKSEALFMSPEEKVELEESNTILASVQVSDSEVETIVHEHKKEIEECVMETPDNSEATPQIQETSVEALPQDLNCLGFQSSLEVTSILIDLDNNQSQNQISSGNKVDGLQRAFKTEDNSNDLFLSPTVKAEPEESKKRKLLASVHVCDSEVENIVNKRKKEREDDVIKTVDNSEVAPLIQEISVEAPTQDPNYLEVPSELEVTSSLEDLDNKRSKDLVSLTATANSFQKDCETKDKSDDVFVSPTTKAEPEESKKRKLLASVHVCDSEVENIVNKRKKEKEDDVMKTVDNIEVVPLIQEISVEALTQDQNYLEVPSEMEVTSSLEELDEKRSKDSISLTATLNSLQKDCDDVFVSPTTKAELEESKKRKLLSSVHVCDSEVENIINKHKKEKEDDVIKTVDNGEVAPLIQETSVEASIQDQNYLEVPSEMEVTSSLEDLDNKRSKDPVSLTATVNSLQKDCETKDKSDDVFVSPTTKAEPEESKKRKLLASVHVCDSKVENIVNKHKKEKEEDVTNTEGNSEVAPLIEEYSVEASIQDQNFLGVQSELGVTCPLEDLDVKRSQNPVSLTDIVNGLQKNCEIKGKSNDVYVSPTMKVFVSPTMKAEPEESKKRKLLASVHVCDSEVENIVNKNSAKFKRLSKSIEEKDKSSDKLVDEEVAFLQKATWRQAKCLSLILRVI